MRAPLVVIILLLLAAAMGLLIIIIGQKQVLTELQQTLKKGNGLYKRLSDVHTNRAIFTATMEKLVAQGTKALEDLEVAVAALKKEEAQSKANFKACQAKKKNIAEAQTGLEKKRSEMQETFKAESQAWMREIDSLKEMLTARRPICNYVQNNPMVLKMCGTEPAEHLPTMKQKQNVNNFNNTAETRLNSATP